MLSNYERRILNEIEFEFSHGSGRRAKIIAALRPAALVLAVAALVTLATLSADRIIPRTTGIVLVACLGMAVGWLIFALANRHAVGPRIRGLACRARTARGRKQ